MKKIIAFDIGNVLVDVDIDSFVNHICINYGLENNRVQKVVEDLMFLDFIGDGSICKKMSSIFSIPEDIVRQAWNNTLSVNQKMIDFIKNIKYDIYIFSNMGRDHYNYLNEIGFFKNIRIDECQQFISFKLGVAKPARTFYNSFITEINIAKLVHKSKWACPDYLPDIYNSEIYYLDDSKENIEAAKKLGWIDYPIYFNLKDGDVDFQIDMFKTKISEEFE